MQQNQDIVQALTTLSLQLEALSNKVEKQQVHQNDSAQDSQGFINNLTSRIDALNPLRDSAGLEKDRECKKIL